MSDEQSREEDMAQLWKKHRHQIDIEIGQRTRGLDPHDFQTNTKVILAFILDELAGARFVIEQQNHHIQQLKKRGK